MQEGIYYVTNPTKDIPWIGVNELGQVGSTWLLLSIRLLNLLLSVRIHRPNVLPEASRFDSFSGLMIRQCARLTSRYFTEAM